MSKSTVIIINGYARAGKDTFVGFLNDHVSGGVIEHSTIDFSKYIAELMGWNGIKSIHSREMLSELKEFSNKWFDKSFKDMVTLIESNHMNKVIVFHIREPKEIKRVSDWCDKRDVNIITIFVSGIRSETDQSNDSDLNARNYPYDDYIINNGTLDEYKINTIQLLNKIL